MSFFRILYKESFQNPISSVPCAAGNRQHNSRPTQLGFFKFPDECADCDGSDYGADNFRKHRINYLFLEFETFNLVNKCPGSNSQEFPIMLTKG